MEINCFKFWEGTSEPVKTIIGEQEARRILENNYGQNTCNLGMIQLSECKPLFLEKINIVLVGKEANQ